MKNRWNEDEAARASNDLELRAYSSRLIGKDPALVLHGGGNTSVKSTEADRFGAQRPVIWVKASGFDLGTMGAEGFTALDLASVTRLAGLEHLSDPDMVNEVARARLDSNAAAASIEAIVHALIPFKFVDHSHADAILTISNSPEGAARFAEIYGDRVLVLPYVKPGFDLALQFRQQIAEKDLSQYEAVILEHHGIFTFSDSARDSYNAMIKVVDEAERYLLDNYGSPRFSREGNEDAVEIARIRRLVSELASFPVISLKSAKVGQDKAKRYGTLLRGGTVTPEHVIHNKPFPALLGDDPEAGLLSFRDDYRGYFDRAGNHSLQMLPPYPHWAISSDGYTRSFGRDLKRASISSDVAETSLKAMYYADKMGGWQGLGEDDLRGLEYWELEQAKLKRQPPPSELTGKIAMVAGAASGIGYACAELLADKGAVVVGLDISPSILGSMNRPGFEGLVCDLTDEDSVAAAFRHTAETYGGLDILVTSAGIFRTGNTIETLEDDNWDQSMAINLSAHRKVLKQAIPFLRHGIEPAVVFIASRNVTAPGAGAAAYSVSKAGLTQLMRVAALELAADGITVNAVHPDAVFDTGLWTEQALATSAARYGLSVEEYKTRNLLKTEITSRDVARAVSAFVDGTLPKTTGAQLPVDGGNDRVI
ncbi:SDR family oxidoreductase [Labrenzia sp. PHM005]|uniref:SDR family oxidoreductase n=1 Tax=Labrenzia sp. PHM005 TaxID=2590016 RepID=UPI0011406AEA|nr:SDR family oxidoreductase [Labrenzia sp. PHM005]QDG78173.1 SDR family oxidoreductase [Labrenzia sp. PHM005]